MPYTKISPATKKQALEKLAQGMAMKDVGKMFGISSKTLAAWTKPKKDSSLASTPSPSSKTAESESQDEEASQQVKPVLDFEQSPASPDKKGGLEGAWTSLKGMLGISDKKEAQPVLSAKLDAKKQQFVDSVTPTLSLGFIFVATYLWKRTTGDDRYAAVLAPDEQVAKKIVEPLLRIYARHANFLSEINPDVIDVGASMFALVGYVDASMRMYQHIKESEQNEAAQGTEGTYPTNGNGGRGGNWRTYRPTTQDESGTGNAGGGLADVFGSSGNNGNGNGTNGGYPGSVDIPNLTEQEARQHAALSRLSQMDYQHRARRSGNGR